MRANTPRPLRSVDPEPSIDECLTQAFQVILGEGVPVRFRVLLDALYREGSDYDPAESDSNST